MNCLSCSYHTSFAFQPLGEDAQHFVGCPKGLRLHSAVSDRVKDELAYILERCNIRVIAERPGSHRQMSSFMLREGSSLLKQPDIIIPDLDGPRSFTLIDVKIFDPAAPSYADSSAKSAQHRHRALETAVQREYLSKMKKLGVKMRPEMLLHSKQTRPELHAASPLNAELPIHMYVPVGWLLGGSLSLVFP